MVGIIMNFYFAPSPNDTPELELIALIENVVW